MALVITGQSLLLPQSAPLSGENCDPTVSPSPKASQSAAWLLPMAVLGAAIWVTALAVLAF